MGTGTGALGGGGGIRLRSPLVPQDLSQQVRYETASDCSNHHKATKNPITQGDWILLRRRWDSNPRRLAPARFPSVWNGPLSDSSKVSKQIIDDCCVCERGVEDIDRYPTPPCQAIFYQLVLPITSLKFSNGFPEIAKFVHLDDTFRNLAFSVD